MASIHPDDHPVEEVVKLDCLYVTNETPRYEIPPLIRPSSVAIAPAAARADGVLGKNTSSSRAAPASSAATSSTT